MDLPDDEFLVPLPDFARRTFGPVWPMFREEWSGFTSDDPLWEDSPEAMVGARRLFNACYVAGMRHPLWPTVSADYVSEVRRSWRFEDPDWNDDEHIARALSDVPAAGHPQGWPLASVSGRTFQLQVRLLERKGHDITPRLARQKIGAGDLDYLASVFRDLRLTNHHAAELLCDFRGGVYFAEHLDARGLALVEVATEMMMAGYGSAARARP